MSLQKAPIKNKLLEWNDRIFASLQHSPWDWTLGRDVAESGVNFVQKFVDQTRGAATFRRSVVTETTTHRPASRVVDQIVFDEIRIGRRFSVFLVAGVDVAPAVVVDRAVASKRHRPRVALRPVEAHVVVDVQVDVDVGAARCKIVERFFVDSWRSTENVLPAPKWTLKSF